MSNVIPFDFRDKILRALLIDDEPWFVAKEVSNILGYSDAQAMTRKLDADEVQNRQIVGFGNRGVNLINESGLYSVILTSQKEEAKAFKRWVTHEVLPSIRKTGKYDHVDTSTAPIALLQDMVNRIALTEQQRDEAIRTKAQIGNKREATAMARASFEKRRADQLERELGDHTLWKSAKSIDWVPNVLATSRAMWSQFGKYLSKLSKEMGRECKTIEDSAYGSIKAYHIDVITEAYKRIKADDGILHKYRAIQEGAA